MISTACWSKSFYNFIHIREGAHGKADDFLTNFDGARVACGAVASGPVLLNNRFKARLFVQRLRVVDAVRNSGAFQMLQKRGTVFDQELGSRDRKKI